MNKTAFLILISLCLSVLAQLPNAPPRCPKDAGDSCDFRVDSSSPDSGDAGDEAVTAQTLAVANNIRQPDNSGRCQIVFYANYNVVYTRNLSRSRRRDFMSRLSGRADNNIDLVEYYGECYCWINFFSSRSYRDNSIGFWVSPDDDGTIYLSDYQSYDQRNDQWEQWDRVISSYWINCYFD